MALSVEGGMEELPKWLSTISIHAFVWHHSLRSQPTRAAYPGSRGPIQWWHHNMAWESAFGSVIEVAIAITGFSGIVAALGRRGAGTWTEADQLRLRILLAASGSATGYAFLPFVLADLVDPSVVWRIASSLLAVHNAAMTLHRIRQASSAGINQAVGGRRWIPMIGTVLVVSMLLMNAVIWASWSIYLLGNLWGIFIAFINFVELLLGAWRDQPDSSPESSRV